MKKLILLLILITIGFSVTVERPWNYEKWEKENPSIINSMGLGLWNTWLFQYSLDQMNISEMEFTGNEKVDGLVSKIKEAYSEAQLKNDLCTMTQLTWPNKCLSLLNVLDIWNTMNGYLACFEYGEPWKETMNYAMDIVEESQEEVGSEINKLEKDYENLEESGVCEEDYPREVGVCTRAESALENYNGEFVYGEESVFYEVWDSFKNLSHISSYMPEMRPFTVYVGSVWGEQGVLVQSEEIREEIDEALAQETEYIEGIIEESKDSLGEREAEFKLLEKQKLEKIISGAEMDEYLGEEIISIKEEFESIEIELEESKELVEEATRIYKQEEEDYLKESLILASGSVGSLEELGIRMQVVEEEATGIVESKEKKTSKEISEFEKESKGIILSTETEELYKIAKEYYTDGNEEEILGEKYDYYYNSMKYITLAEASFKKEEGETELEFLTLVEEVEKILKGAKQDGLEVEYEQVEFEYLKKHQSLEFYDELEGLKESIIEKSRIRFGYLEGAIGNIEETAQIAGGELDYLLLDFYKSKNEIFGYDGIEYEKGIGKLKNFETEYFEIKGKIEGMLEKIMEKKVESKIETSVGVGYIDQESIVRDEIIVNNKANYNFEELDVELALLFERIIYLENIIYGEKNIEDILVNGKKLKLYLKDILQGREYYFIIEKNEEVVRTTDFEKKSKGNVDGSAEIEEKYTIFSDYELGSLVVPECLGRVNSVELDGKEIESGTIEKNIKSGKHIIENKCILEEAFEYNKTNVIVSSIGTKNQVSYDIIITPKIDLDSTMLLIEDGLGEGVEELKVVSYTSENIKNKQFFKNGEYSFEIEGLEEGINAIVKVSYLVDNSSAYLEGEILKIEKLELNEYETGLLSEVKEKKNENKINEAISVLKELENNIESKQNSEYKLQKKHDELVESISGEWKEIGGVLSELQEMNDSFVYKLESRYEELGEILDENKSISEKISELEGVDQKWLEKESKNFVKDTYKKYNKIKGEFIENGIEGYETQFKDFEELLVEFEVKKDLEKVREILEELDLLENSFEQESIEVGGVYSTYKEKYDSVVSGIKNKLEKYSKQQTQAKGTSYEYLFNYSKSGVNSEISSIGKLIDGRKTVGEIESGIEELNKIKENIEETLDYLEKESKRRVGNLEIYIEEIPKEKQEEISKSIEELQQLVSEGEYLAALKGSETVIEEISGSKKNEDNLLLIGIVALVVMSLVGVVLLRERISIKKIENKEKKKLKRVS